MECKNCGAEIEESLLTCPCCGESVDADLVIADDVETITEECCTDESAEEYCEEIESEEEAEAEVPVATVKPRKTWQILVAIGCCVVLLASLVFMILNSMGISFAPKANDILYKSNYVVEDEVGQKKGNKVVATVGDMKLTNSELQIYYTQQIYEYAQYYGSVLTYVGLDLTKPLAEQSCTFDETLTWQQYFINVSIETWQHYAVLNMLAKEVGLSLPDSQEAVLTAMPAELETMAKGYGLASADELIQHNYGKNVDVQAYVNYMRTRYLGEYYYSTKTLEMMPTDAEVEAYFAAHEADFTASGITKDSGPIVDVRHILVQPEGGTKGESGYNVYTDDAWAKALTEAESILETWKNGAADEASFATLTGKHTDDTGYASNGGLYQNITKSSNYVKEFLEWSLDESRQVGDTGIIKTVYGYHIMYFVTGQPQWEMSAQTQILSERLTAVIDSGSEKWPVDVNYKNLAVCVNDIVQ